GAASARAEAERAAQATMETARAEAARLLEEARQDARAVRADAEVAISKLFAEADAEARQAMDAAHQHEKELEERIAARAAQLADIEDELTGLAGMAADL